MTPDFTEQNSSLTLGKGINTDFTATEVNKVAYDKGFYTVFRAAGFDSVRFLSNKAGIRNSINRQLTMLWNSV